MKIVCMVMVVLIFTSCGQNVNSDNKLMLNPTVTRLGEISERAVRHWDAYRDLENNLKLIYSTNSLNATSFREPLLNNIKAMGRHIPQSLRTASVQKSLKIVDNQIVSFYQEVGEDELNQRIVERHVDSIMIAFGKLNQCLNRCLVQTH